MGSRPIDRTVQECLFKRIRISSDCEEALQTSCISHSQTHSCPQITSVRLVTNIIWILFHFFFFKSYSGSSGFCLKSSRVLFDEEPSQHGITVLVRSKYSSLCQTNILFHIRIIFLFDLIIFCFFSYCMMLQNYMLSISFLIV